MRLDAAQVDFGFFFGVLYFILKIPVNLLLCNISGFDFQRKGTVLVRWAAVTEYRRLGGL